VRGDHLGAPEPGLELLRPLRVHHRKRPAARAAPGESPELTLDLERGADGIPAGVCVPDPMNGGCVAPFHDSSDENYGGPHGAAAAAADIDGGAMDGFVSEAERGAGCQPDDPTCSPCNAQVGTAQVQQSKCDDVMGYHDAREVPNYWAYAQNFALQDHMFEPNASWSLPAALYKVSEWSAYCTNPSDPSSCRNALDNPNPDGGYAGPNDGQLH
jgi:hypothetical protein